MKGFLTFGIIAVIIAVIAIPAYITNYNYGNRAEKTIEAEYSNMENILSNYTLKVSEAAQVPSIYKDDVKEILGEVMGGRYGADGSKAMFQWIQEQNPTVDVAVYSKIQVIIEAGRNEFQNAQTKFIDTKRSYETNLGYLYKGFWLKVAGYPKIDLENDYVIISNSQTQETFKTKIDTGVQLRPQ